MRIGNVIGGAISTTIGIIIIVWFMLEVSRPHQPLVGGPTILEAAIILGIAAFLLIMGLRFLVAGIKGKKPGES